VAGASAAGQVSPFMTEPGDKSSAESSVLATRWAAWQPLVASLACSLAAFALTYGALQLGPDVGLVAVVLAILVPALFLTVPASSPVLTASAAAAGWWLVDGIPPDATVVLGTLAGTTVIACASIASRALRTRRGRELTLELEHEARQLALANAAQREASEVAEAMLAATQDISASIEGGEVAMRIARNACAATRSVASAVLLCDPEREVFRIAAVAGGGGGTEVQQLEVGLRAAAPLQVAISEGMADVPRSALHDPVLDALLRRWKAAAVLAARLQRGDRLLGLVLVARRVPTPASPKTCRILSGIALQAAAALEIANLVNDLRTASNLKEEWMATMSHELRTPLNVIIGYTDLQRDGAFGDLSEDHLDTLNRVHEQALQLLDLIQATLDVGRLERGLITVDLQPVEVPELIENLFAAIPPAWRKLSVELRWRVDEAVPVIRSDPAKLQVLLRNLVHNALKFTEAGQVSVSVSTDSNGEWVHFVVQDSGVGIAAQDLNVIFDMFRQSSNRDAAIGGVGLGLYIVKRLVALLGGEIDVRSAPGRGATFRIHLPAAGPHAPAPRPSAALGSRAVRVAL
jgi:signal transduction histidine kinase